MGPAGFGVVITDPGNTAVGDEALGNNTGQWNTATGFQTLVGNTTGNENTALGSYALHSNTTGSLNTATGVLALSNNTTGHDNTANGLGTLLGNTTGSENTALGFSALFLSIPRVPLTQLTDHRRFIATRQGIQILPLVLGAFF